MYQIAELYPHNKYLVLFFIYKFLYQTNECESVARNVKALSFEEKKNLNGTVGQCT